MLKILKQLDNKRQKAIDENLKYDSKIFKDRYEKSLSLEYRINNRKNYLRCCKSLNEKPIKVSDFEFAKRFKEYNDELVQTLKSQVSQKEKTFIHNFENSHSFDLHILFYDKYKKICKSQGVKSISFNNLTNKA